MQLCCWLLALKAGEICIPDYYTCTVLCAVQCLKSALATLSANVHYSNYILTPKVLFKFSPFGAQKHQQQSCIIPTHFYFLNFLLLLKTSYTTIQCTHLILRLPSSQLENAVVFLILRILIQSDLMKHLAEHSILYLFIKLSSVTLAILKGKWLKHS